EAARAGRDEVLDPALERRPAIAAVAGEDFVAALAGQDHLQPARGLLGQERRRQAGVVVQQIVGGPDGVRQAAEDGVAIEDDLGVLGAEAARDRRRLG